MKALEEIRKDPRVLVQTRVMDGGVDAGVGCLLHALQHSAPVGGVLRFFVRRHGALACGLQRLLHAAFALASAPFVIWSNGGGWDHVSVSYPKRCPTWEEMCKIKEVFFLPDECCVEFHPAAEDYVNVHQYCLHIWRPQNVAIPKPPKIYV